MKYLLPLACLLCSLLTQAQDSRADVDPALAPFYHGVASGDPLADRVIIWTRVTTQEPSVEVYWEMATDTNFANVITFGTTSTDASRDYTVKLDIPSLEENTWYYYRFKVGDKYSIVGRTRTSPSSSVSNLRFAVVACSNYQDGYFNAYRDIANKNDIDAVIHLGDYYYEYGTADFTPEVDSSRLHEPATEITTLADYRLRNSQYKLDPDLREIHRQYPFITVWDDHETANDSWSGGAQNHTDSLEGNWTDRKEYGRRTYFEWMPIRDVHNSVDTIHRVIPMGGLLDLIMIDSRLEGREIQMGTTGAATDTNRTMLGAPQLAWFKEQLSNSTAKWKLIGNQVMISPLKLGGNALNADQWDGYPAERKKILDHIRTNNIDNVVVLTGDIHTSWANDLPVDGVPYTSSTGAGSVGVEFVCTSVTSGSFFTFNPPITLIQSSNPNIKYANLINRGYVLLDVATDKVQSDWVYVNTITSKNFTSSVGASWCDMDGDNHLTQCNFPLAPRTNRPAQAPLVTDINNTAQENVVMIATYPNPFDEEIAVQYYMNKPAKVELRISDINGKTIYTQTENATQTGLYNTRANISNLAAGTYVVSVVSGSKVYSQRIVKVK